VKKMWIKKIAAKPRNSQETFITISLPNH